MFSKKREDEIIKEIVFQRALRKQKLEIARNLINKGFSKEIILKSLDISDEDLRTVQEPKKLSPFEERNLQIRSESRLEAIKDCIFYALKSGNVHFKEETVRKMLNRIDDENILRQISIFAAVIGEIGGE